MSNDIIFGASMKTPAIQGPEWQIDFQPFRARGNGIELTKLPTNRTVELLRILVAHQGRWLNRDSIARKIWGEEDMIKTRASMRQALAMLRKAFQPTEVILVEGNHLALAVPVSKTNVDRTIESCCQIRSNESPTTQFESNLDYYRMAKETGDPELLLDAMVSSSTTITIPVKDLRDLSQHLESRLPANHPGQTWCAYFLGYSDILLGRYKDAKSRFCTLRNLSKAENDDQMFWESSVYLSFCATELARPDKAWHVANEARSGVNRSTHPVAYYRLTHAMGAALAHAGHSLRGVEMIEVAAEGLRKVAEPIHRAHTCSNLYLFAAQNGFRHVAEVSKLEAIEAADLAADWRSREAVRVGEMVEAIRDERLDHAKSKAQQLITNSKKHECRQFQVYAYEGLAEVAIKEDNYDDANEFYSMAINNRLAHGFHGTLQERRRLRQMAETLARNVANPKRNDVRLF